MGLFTLLARCWAPARRPRRAWHLDARLEARLEAPTLSPRRLERRRVLDAAGAGLVLGPLAGTSEFVQAGALDDNPTDTPPVAQSASSPEAGISANSAPTITTVLTLPDNTVENDVPIGLFVSFSDIDLADTHTVEINWGDLTPTETIVLDQGSRSLLTSHLYLDDNDTGTPFDTNTVQVTVTDSSEACAIGSAPVMVSNVAPQIDFLSITSPVDENGVVQLQMTFVDQGILDTHRVEIDWDGDTVFDETIVLDPGARALATSHQYLDDNPTGTPSDKKPVVVKVIDDDMGSGMATRDAVVNNVAPTIDSLSITSPINENGTVELTGTFKDIGRLDTHTLTIDWDDPNNGLDSVFELAAIFELDTAPGVLTPQLMVGDMLASVTTGDATMLEITSINSATGTIGYLVLHQYLDDGLAGSTPPGANGTSEDTSTIVVTVTDDDTGEGTAEQTVLVKNVAPAVVLDPVTMIDENGFTTLRGTITDVGSLDIFTLDIAWGDPLSPANTQSFGLGTAALTEGTDGINWDPLTRVFSLTHQYANDNPSVSPFDTFTIDVTVTDDDTGVGMDSKTVDVRNENLVVVLAKVADVLENGSATLNGTFSDDSILDTHRLTIEWDDPNNPFDSVFEVSPILEIDPMSSTLSPVLIVGDVLMSLTPGDPTELTITSIDADSGTVGFQATHQYLDDGTAGATAPGANGTLSDTSTIRVTVEDDDSGLGSSTTTVKVINLDPVINMLSVLPSSINESESVTLSGNFSDIGSLDFHSIEIRWGDGMVDGEGGALTFTQEVSGSGSFLATHTYADNDTENLDDPVRYNLYSIVVTITDDDGGKLTKVFDLEVLNVNPVLEPIAKADATDVNSDGETTVTITFSDVGTDELFIWIDWGDIRDPTDPFLPGADPFVIETPTSITGAGTFTITLSHTYLGPPNPLSPASDIEIFVVIVDDDFNFVAAGGQVDGPLATQPIVEPGRSEFQLVTISNPGLGTIPVRIDTTPQVPRLVFASQTESTLFFQTSTSGEGLLKRADLSAAAGDTKATNERFLELRIIDSSGEMGEGIRLKSEVLGDLPGLFGRLADNRYAIFLVHTETNTRRLVIEFFIRNGRAIDPGDDSEGTRDRPPTDEASQQPARQQPILPDAEEANSENSKKSAAMPDLPADGAYGDTHSWSPLVGTALVAGSSYRNWAQQVDRTVAAAGTRQWRRLRTNRPNKRKNK